MVNHRIHGTTGLHHHQDAARPFELVDEFLECVGRLDLFASATASHELIGLLPGAVVNHAGEAIALSIEHKVFTHHTKPDQAEMPLAHSAPHGTSHSKCGHAWLKGLLRH